MNFAKTNSVGRHQIREFAADPEPQPREIRRPEMRDQISHPVVPARRAARPRADRPEFQIDVVENNQKIVERGFEKLQNCRRRLAGERFIKVCGFTKKIFSPVERFFRDLRAEFFFEFELGKFEFLREKIDRAKTKIVPRPGIFCVGIAETKN